MSQPIPKKGDWVCVCYYIPPNHPLYISGHNDIYYGKVTAVTKKGFIALDVYGELTEDNVLTIKGNTTYGANCFTENVCDINNGFRADYQTYVNRVK